MKNSIHSTALRKLKEQIRFYGLNPKDWVLRPTFNKNNSEAQFMLKHREDPSLKLLARFTWRQTFELNHIEMFQF